MLSILVTLLVIVVVCGLLYYCVTLLPLTPQFKNIAMILVLLIAIVWILSSLGIFGAPHLIHVT